MGRRQQRPGDRARRRRRLRAKRRDEHPSPPGRDRSDHDRRLRARPRPWRAALPLLPDRARRPAGLRLMDTIVVGTDGSAGAQRAVGWALEEARLRGAELVILHVWALPLIDALPEAWVLATPVGHTDERLHDADGGRGAERSSTPPWPQRGQAGPDVAVRGELAEGRPAVALVEAARDADLLVVGSRGLGGFAGLLLGSVGSQCVHHAPCRWSSSPPSRPAPDAAAENTVAVKPRRPRWHAAPRRRGCRHEHPKRTTGSTHRRGEGRPQDLRHREGQGARAARRQPRDRHAARWSRSWGRPAAARRRCSTASPASTPSTPATSSIDGVDLGRMSDNERTDYRARKHGLRLPVLQPAARAQRRRERRAAAAGLAASQPKEARERALAALEPGRPGRLGQAPAGAALRRPAPARHDRARAGQRPGDRLGRRADRRPRLRERRRDHGPDARPQRGARPDLRHRHARHPVGENADRIVHMLDGQIVRDGRAASSSPADDAEGLRHPRRTPCSSCSRSRSRSHWGSSPCSPSATPCWFKLGVRNVGRRRGRTALIVVGLMLGTTIIATALTTGDTMSHTIRGAAVRDARVRPTSSSRRRAPR